MAERDVTFRLPLEGWPRATFRSDYALRGGYLEVDGTTIVRAATRDDLRAGVDGCFGGAPVLVRLSGDTDRIEVLVAGEPAVTEADLPVKTSRSAWLHAWQALGASAFGFIASYLYLVEARASGESWPLRMGVHMALWHLLLTLTLFPASVWGQRLGIRAVQLVSAVFFAIHAGITIANVVDPDPTRIDSFGIATFNALSGLLFAVATVYGNRAHRDMDPLAALSRVGGD